MKLTPSAFLKRIALLTIAWLTVVADHASAQSSSEQPYYVIVGGFASRDNAAHFTNYLLDQSYPASYAMNTSRSLYYVYVRLTGDKQSAKQLAYHLRLETKFKDAWIYNGSLEGNTQIELAVMNKERQPADEQSVLLAAASTSVAAPAVSAPATVAAEPAVVTTPSSPAAEAAAPAVVGKRFVFQVTSLADHQPIRGAIHVIEAETDQSADTYQTNAEVFVPKPGSGKLIVVCNLVGYKLAKRAINYNEPLKSIKGATMGAADEVIIPIQLVPIEKGDYIELAQVKFLENSTILTPSSEPELVELANLMSNPRCKIRLFGHTHSSEDCDIVFLGKSTSFFAFDPVNNHTRHGSARELSHQRAETVKAYLVSKGIDPGRIATKGYGATLAIYEHASANERIEVQIVRN